MPLAVTPPTVQVLLAEAEEQERIALRTARNLERLGAPSRDVGYALDRAQAAKAMKVHLRRQNPERPSQG